MRIKVWTIIAIAAFCALFNAAAFLLYVPVITVLSALAIGVGMLASFILGICANRRLRWRRVSAGPAANTPPTGKNVTAWT
jgi:hypothetical protein